MRRVIAIANGKGGVGKTSLTAGLTAAAGYRILTVDADPQGNLRRDMGYDSSSGELLEPRVVVVLGVHRIGDHQLS